MKIPSSYLRQTLFTLLDGNVVYDGDTIPVFENEGDVLPRQIIIADYSDADRSNKNDFGSNATQVIEVVCEQKDAVRKHADAIGELVGNIIHPTTQSALLDGTDFSVMVVGKPSINHLTEDSGSGTKIVRLILRYSLLINEN